MFRAMIVSNRTIYLRSLSITVETKVIIRMLKHQFFRLDLLARSYILIRRVVDDFG